VFISLEPKNEKNEKEIEPPKKKTSIERGTKDILISFLYFVAVSPLSQTFFHH